jgi:uncharacterized YccA/Bax inhibitor family protein
MAVIGSMPVIETEFVIMILALIIGVILILNSIKQFLFNAITGLIVLFLANAFLGLGIGYSWPVIIICGIGGIIGALLVIVIALHLMGIPFW